MSRASQARNFPEELTTEYGRARAQYEADQSLIRQLREGIAVEGAANEELREQVDALTRQRDELRASASAVMARLDYHTKSSPCDCVNAMGPDGEQIPPFNCPYCLLRAAIAGATKGSSAFEALDDSGWFGSEAARSEAKARAEGGPQ